MFIVQSQAETRVTIQKIHFEGVCQNKTCFRACLCCFSKCLYAVLKHIVAVLEQGVLLNGTCFYFENQVFVGVSNQNMFTHVTSQKVLLLATIQFCFINNFLKLHYVCCTDSDSSPCALCVMTLLNFKAACLTSLGSAVLEQYGYKHR